VKAKLYQSYTIHISLIKQQYVITHTIRQTEIPALLNSLFTNTPSVRIFFPQKYCLSLYFRKKHNMLQCWSIKYRSSFLCLLVNSVSVGYVKLLFHEKYACHFFESDIYILRVYYFSNLTFEFMKEPREIHDCSWSFRAP
jgi:hypothetical protein